MAESNYDWAFGLGNTEDCGTGGNGKTANTGNSFTYNANWCGNRLPCGYCKELGRLCPMQGVTYPNQPYTYGTEITCEAKNGT